MIFTIFSPINAPHYLFIYFHYHPIINLVHYLFIYFHYHPIINLYNQSTSYLFSSIIKSNSKSFQFSLKVLCEPFQFKGGKNKTKQNR